MVTDIFLLYKENRVQAVVLLHFEDKEKNYTIKQEMPEMFLYPLHNHSISVKSLSQRFFPLI